MLPKYIHRFFTYLFLGGVVISWGGCIDPIAPEFRFRDGFILIDGQVTSEVGGSRVTISRTRREGNRYRIEPYFPAEVSIVDEAGNATPMAFEEGGTEFLAPPAFAGAVGSSYFLRVVTPEGDIIRSAPERMPFPVAIEDFRVKFEQNAYFSDNLNRFVPSFRLLVDYRDPPGERNYYRWRYVSWEQLDACLTCVFSRVIFDDGVCIDTPNSGVRKWDYFCAEDCYRFDLSTTVNVASDEFTDGNLVSAYEAGRDDWDWYGGLLLIVEQQSITEAAFTYQNLIRELSEGSGGLNATLPAALDGNIDPADPNGPPALGYFGAAGVSRAHVYFNRDTTDGVPLPFDGELNYDVPLIGAPYAHPCEGYRRVIVPPEEWPE